MKIKIGIDVGQSASKIVGFHPEKGIVGTLRVEAEDQLTALYGAIGRFLYENEIDLEDVEEILATGVGASFLDKDVYGIPTYHIPEMDTIGAGGRYLSGLEKTLVMSLGTGSAFVYVDQDQVKYLDGSAVGGGTIVGLSKLLTGKVRMENILALAETGDVANVDLLMSEISTTQVATLPGYATASNFGSIKGCAKEPDYLVGLFNMVFQIVGTMAYFNARQVGVKDIVVIGTLATVPYAKTFLDRVGELYGVTFIIPELAPFANAIGAVLVGREGEKK